MITGLVYNFKFFVLQFYQELSIQIKSRFNFTNPHLNFISNFNPFKVVYDLLPQDIE